MVGRQFEKQIKKIQSDNGGEYVNNDVKKFFEEEGIEHILTPAYSHESNGLAERFNRTITTMARTSMQEIDIKSLWAESITTAVYLKNCLPDAAMLTEITPYFALHNKNPSIHHLQPFWKACYVHIPD
jgi:transposase InsO family protein